MSSNGKDTYLKHHLKLGKFEIQDLVAQTFRTSTPRVIGVALDLINLQLRYWIDGRPLDDMVKTLPAAGKAWIPTVVITEPELEVILNPFCVSCEPSFSSGLIPKSVKDLHSSIGGQCTFPAGLCEPIESLQSDFLAHILRNYMILVDVPAPSSAGTADPVAELLKNAMTIKPKLDLEEAKYDEAVEVEKSDQGDDESTIPKYDTHMFPKPKATTKDTKETDEAKDKEKNDVITMALLKFDGHNDALRFLVNNQQRKH